MKQAGDEVHQHSLGQVLTRIAYVVVNVSSLERARAFYETATPLRVVGRISAPRQPLAGLGLEEGEFDGYVLDDGTGGTPTEVHLVEWKTPRPVGVPYPVFWHVGLCRLGIATAMPAETRLAQLADAGIAPTNTEVVGGYITIADPDGSLISFLRLPTASVRYDHLAHTNPSQTDVERSMRFYRDVLGLLPHLDVVPTEPVSSSAGPGADRAQWDSRLLSTRGDRRFSIDVSQFLHPAHTPDTVLPYQTANHLGICRVGFEVDDIEAGYDLLREVEPTGQAPGIVGPPEAWDLGPELGTRRVLCFRDPDGVMLELVERPPRDPSSYISYGASSGGLTEA